MNSPIKTQVTVFLIRNLICINIQGHLVHSDAGTGVLPAGVAVGEERTRLQLESTALCHRINQTRKLSAKPLKTEDY